MVNMVLANIGLSLLAKHPKKKLNMVEMWVKYMVNLCAWPIKTVPTCPGTVNMAVGNLGK